MNENLLNIEPSDQSEEEYGDEDDEEDICESFNNFEIPAVPVETSTTMSTNALDKLRCGRDVDITFSRRGDSTRSISRRLTNIRRRNEQGKSIKPLTSYFVQVTPSISTIDEVHDDLVEVSGVEPLTIDEAITILQQDYNQALLRNQNVNRERNHISFFEDVQTLCAMKYFSFVKGGKKTRLGFGLAVSG